MIAKVILSGCRGKLPRHYSTQYDKAIMIIGATEAVGLFYRFIFRDKRVGVEATQQLQQHFRKGAVVCAARQLIGIEITTAIKCIIKIVKELSDSGTACTVGCFTTDRRLVVCDSGS